MPWPGATMVCHGREKNYWNLGTIFIILGIL
jgi:hypothetical protein